MRKYELAPRWEDVQSYYGKSHILDMGRFLILRSYNTDVCTIDMKKHTYSINSGNGYENFLTQTTLRHIKEFLKQHFYFENITLTKKSILKDAQ